MKIRNMPQWRGLSARLCTLSIFLGCCSAVPVSPETNFNALKTLQGTWNIEAKGKELAIEMSYEVGSRDSIVTERYGKEPSVFYRNGESLEMVHFCNSGNQPRLRLKKASQPGLLNFEMFAATNLSSPDATHVRELMYRIIDANTVRLTIVWWPKTTESEEYTLKRIRANK